MLAVKATPRASKNEIRGWTDNSCAELSVRVTTAPTDGKANKAICELIASSIGVAKSKVCVVRGDTSRHKMIEIDVLPEVYDAWIAKFQEIR